MCETCDRLAVALAEARARCEFERAQQLFSELVAHRLAHGDPGLQLVRQLWPGAVVVGSYGGE